MKNTIKIGLILSGLMLSLNASAFWGNGFNPMDDFFGNNNNHYNNNNNYKQNYRNNGYYNGAGYNNYNNDMFGNGMGDIDINMDMDMKFKMKMDGDMIGNSDYRGNANGYTDQNYSNQNFWRADTGVQNYNTYAPRGAYSSYNYKPKKSYQYYQQKIRQQQARSQR